MDMIGKIAKQRVDIAHLFKPYSVHCGSHIVVNASPGLVPRHHDA